MRTWKQALRAKLGEQLRRRTVFAASPARFSYVRGDLQDADGYRRLLEELGKPKTGVCSNIVFYLAIKPERLRRRRRATWPRSA